MDFSGLSAFRQHHRRLHWLTLLLLLVAATSTATAQDPGMLRGDDFIKITRLSKMTWSLDTAIVRLKLLNVQFKRFEDTDAALRDSSRTWRTFVTGTGITIDSTTPGLYIITVTGGTGFDPDSLDVPFTLGPRKLTASLLASGASLQVLQTVGGVATWMTDPGLPGYTNQFFYWGSISHNTATDTSGGKHIAYVGQLSKEWPITHSGGSVYTGIAGNFYMRGNSYETHSATMTTVGSGVTALVAGDRIVLRFFPIGSSFDKYVKVYRIPAGFRPDGFGSGGTAVYGEQIGHFLIPAAKFSTSPTSTNLECTLSLKSR